MAKVLLVIDMLRDFIESDGRLYCGSAGEHIIPFIVQKCKEFQEQGVKIIFVCDQHESEDLEFQRFPAHCVKDTIGAEIIPALQMPHCEIITKKRYSAFFGTELELRLQGIEEVHLVGVCTNICVLYTAEELCNRDKTVVVYRDGVASFDLAAHDFALDQMEKVLGVTLK